MESERFRAERALDRYSEASRAELESLQWPAAARRIHEARSRMGLSDDDVAHRLGMTSGSYWDLEHDKDEAFNVATLGDLHRLGTLVGVEPRVLLLGSEVEDVKQTITFAEISSGLAQRLAESGMTVDQLGEAIGWDVTGPLADPDVLWGYDVEALYKICKGLGFDWVAAVPRLRSS